MITQLYTDFSVQTAPSKSQPTKRDEAAGETSFSGELKKRLDETNESRQSAENGTRREQKVDSGASRRTEQPDIDETENPQQQANAAMQMISFLGTMIPAPVLDMPMENQAGIATQQEPPDITVCAVALPNAVAVLQTASQQNGGSVALEQSAETNGAMVLAQVSKDQPENESPRVLPALEVENTQSPEPRFSLNQGKQSGSDSKSQMTSDSVKTPDKPQTQSKTQPDSGQLNAFAQRLDDAGLTIQTVSAKGQSDAPPATQVATAVLEAYNTGKTEFTMKLEPESLGELTVKLVYEQGRVSLSILTANDQTTKLISAQMAELKSALKESNIQIETCSVENQAFNNLASGGQFSMQGGRQQRPEHTQRFTIQRLPTTAADSLTPVQILSATSILNCYV